ncbi:hypothetical protein [uncultured Jatrophihabitans sp.]|uniref:hypothetical protein n=1 Tax=uncultured Jatrophihabitans sp. TaxID=1610747 RepID=UPI0035CA1B31
MDLARSLRATVAAVATRTDLGAVLLFGNGRHFCVGGELADSARHPSRARSSPSSLARCMRQSSGCGRCRYR